MHVECTSAAHDERLCEIFSSFLLENSDFGREIQWVGSAILSAFSDFELLVFGWIGRLVNGFVLLVLWYVDGVEMKI